MNDTGLNFEGDKDVFKAQVLICSTKFAKNTPPQFEQFRDSLEGAYDQLFKKANISNIEAFWQDAFGIQVWERFMASPDYAVCLRHLNAVDRNAWNKVVGRYYQQA
jgi:hypothetical protein